MSEIFARALPCILYFVAAASVISTEEALDNSLDEDNDDHEDKDEQEEEAQEELEPKQTRYIRASNEEDNEVKEEHED
mgnify:CR=1 FL=1